MAKFPGLLRPNGRRLYTVRVKVPEHLQEIVASLLSEEASGDKRRRGRANGAKHPSIQTKLRAPARTREIWRSTHTADFSEAKRAYPKLRDEINALLAEAERRYAPARKVSAADLQLLVRGWFYRWNRIADEKFRPPQCSEEYTQNVAILDEDEAATLGDFEQPGVEDPGVQQIVDRFIKQNKIAAVPGSSDWWQIVRLIQATSLELLHRERLRLNGTVVEQHRDRLFEGISATGPAPKLSHTPAMLRELFDAWAKERKFAPKTRYSWERIIAKLARHLGHEGLADTDAGSITELDIIAWKDALVAGSLAPKTISNHLVIIRGFFGWAAKNKRVARNPAAGIEYKAKDDPNSGKLSFSDDDARRILLAARKEKEAHKRWAPWLCAFSGARIDEVCGAMVADVRREGEVSYLRIDTANREQGGSVKNRASIRNVPLHPAVIAEGFLDYVGTLAKDSPLFPKLPPDKFGKRGGNGSKTIGRWVRQNVGIADKRKQPNHGWRHRFADECRKVGVPREIRFAIDGHADETVGGRYGSEGYPLQLLAGELKKIKSPF